ncbi:MAG TPA: SDR family oxidoreductase [Chitinophagaceae bacterium]|nr:SDR family oxidoreductase [Chitinophagaceae bacterium]
MPFSNKNILVVGGSAGIGFSLVEHLLAQGATVFNLSRHPGKWQQPVNHQDHDVTATEQNLAAFLPAQLHGVFYSVGNIRLKPFNRITPAEFLIDYNLNVVGAVNVLQQALPALKMAGGASVVLVSSVAATTGMAFHASTGTAKAAVEGLVRSLAAELASQRIRVNAVAPSLTDTPMAQPLLNTEEKKAGAARRHPLGRYGKPEDIASVASFLLSDESSWITGQVIGANGGLGTIGG